MSQDTGKILNVPEPTAEHETTAATAQAEAKTSQLAREIEHNADEVQGVATQAAKAAESLGPSFTGNVPVSDQLKLKTEAAVSEGQQDVDAAKTAGIAYVEQAKGFAAGAIQTAQSYLPPSLGGTNK